MRSVRLREQTAAQTAALERTAEKTREWLERRIADDSLDIARLHRASRDELISKVRKVYEDFLGNEPTLIRARTSGANRAIEQAVNSTVNSLAEELNAHAVQRLTTLLSGQATQVNRYAAPAGIAVDAIHDAERAVLGELTTAVGGGSFYDRAFHITDQIRSRVTRDVRQSLLNGDEFNDLRNKLLQAFGVDRLQAPEGTAYGSVKIYKNEARRQWNLLMDDTTDDVEGGVQVWWAMVDDPDTTPGCLARHGRRIDEDLDGEIPPRHVNCRCTIAVFDEEDDLGAYRADAMGALADQGYTRRRAMLEEAWDPAEHPREPAGQPEGGQFSPKGAGTLDSRVAHVPDAVAQAVAERPGRATHGHTSKNAFFITADGRVFPYNEYEKVAGERGLVVVHSHAADVGADDPSKEDFQPLNSRDIKSFLQQPRQVADVVIMRDGRMEMLVKKGDPDLYLALGKKTKKLDNMLHPSYEERTAYYEKHKDDPDYSMYNQERERLRDFALKYGLIYHENLRWKESKRESLQTKLSEAWWGERRLRPAYSLDPGEHVGQIDGRYALVPYNRLPEVAKRGLDTGRYPSARRLDTGLLGLSGPDSALLRTPSPRLGERTPAGQVEVLGEDGWSPLVPRKAPQTWVEVAGQRVLDSPAVTRWDRPWTPQNPYRRAAVLAQAGPGQVWAVRSLGYLDWKLPGGHLDPGETPEQAAAREFEEETGLSVRIVGKVGTLYRHWSTTEVYAGLVGDTGLGDPKTKSPGEIEAVSAVKVENLAPEERVFIQHKTQELYGGKFEVIPSTITDVVIASPHGEGDTGTRRLVKQIAKTLGLPAVIVKGFTAAHTGNYRINVNRPTEGTGGWDRPTETETDRAGIVYGRYKAHVWQAAGGVAPKLYIEIHDNDAPETQDALEVATVGVTPAEAKYLKNAWSKVGILGVGIRVEPVDKLHWYGTVAKKKGIFALTPKALQVELPIKVAEHVDTAGPLAEWVRLAVALRQKR